VIILETFAVFHTVSEVLIPAQTLWSCSNYCVGVILTTYYDNWLSLSYVLTDATTTSTAATTSSAASVSAEDALNTHQKKMALRSEVFNKARTAHMKEFQARFTKELQVYQHC
jgi:hypothetical protein